MRHFQLAALFHPHQVPSRVSAVFKIRPEDWMSTVDSRMAKGVFSGGGRSGSLAGFERIALQLSEHALGQNPVVSANLVRRRDSTKPGERAQTGLGPTGRFWVATIFRPSKKSDADRRISAFRRHGRRWAGRPHTLRTRREWPFSTLTC